MRFSERKGYKDLTKILQVKSIDENLRNSLWNVLDLGVFDSDSLKVNNYSNSVVERFVIIFHKLWIGYYKKTHDTFPSSPLEMYLELRNDFFSCRWYEVYDLIETILSLLDENDAKCFGRNTIQKALNTKLREENSGYQIIDGKVCEITDEYEIEQVEKALADEDFPQTKIHLQRALELMSDKQNPDYRNSIKESISAVENIACRLSGKSDATLGDALKEIELKGKIHPALKKGFSSIYGYTSDTDGIRHALMEESNLEKADANLFFLLCTVFVNYLKTKF